MKTSTLQNAFLRLVLWLPLSLALAAQTQRDGGSHGHLDHDAGGLLLQDLPPQPPIGSSYDVPPPSYDHQHFDFHPPQQQQQYSSYQTYRPSYNVDPVWTTGPSNTIIPYSTSVASDWSKWGLQALKAAIPLALVSIVLLVIITFLGVIKVPVLEDLAEAPEHLARAMANIDVDQLANTVELAIAKYQELFPVQ